MTRSFNVGPHSIGDQSSSKMNLSTCHFSAFNEVKTSYNTWPDLLPFYLASFLHIVDLPDSQVIFMSNGLRAFAVALESAQLVSAAKCVYVYGCIHACVYVCLHACAHTFTPMNMQTSTSWNWFFFFKQKQVGVLRASSLGRFYFWVARIGSLPRKHMNHRLKKNHAVFFTSLPCKSCVSLDCGVCALMEPKIISLPTPGHLLVSPEALYWSFSVIDSAQSDFGGPKTAGCEKISGRVFALGPILIRVETWSGQQGRERTGRSSLEKCLKWTPKYRAEQFTHDDWYALDGPFCCIVICSSAQY